MREKRRATSSSNLHLNGGNLEAKVDRYTNCVWLLLQADGGSADICQRLDAEAIRDLGEQLRAAGEKLIVVADEVAQENAPRDEATTHEATDYEAQVNDPTTHNVPPMKGAMLDAIAEGELVIDSSPDMRPQGAQGAPLSDMGIGDTHLDAREHDDSDPAARNLDRNSDAESITDTAQVEGKANLAN